jgi:hypothetical protein
VSDSHSRCHWASRLLFETEDSDENSLVVAGIGAGTVVALALFELMVLGVSAHPAATHPNSIEIIKNTAGVFNGCFKLISPLARQLDGFASRVRVYLASWQG